MKQRKFSSLLTIIVLSVSGFAVAKDVTRDEAMQLMEECQKKREEHISPLREKAIEDCVTKQRRDREYCENFNRTFGNARPRGNGTMIPGMFWDIPVCKQAVSAEKYFRMNPSREVYRLP